MVNADEVHTGSSAVDTGWRYRAIYPTPEMMAEISTGFFREKGSAPWFAQAVVRDEGLAAQLHLLFDLLLQPQNALFKQSLYVSTLAYLVSKHGRAKQTLAQLPEAQRKVQMIQDLLAAEPEKEHQLADLAQLAGLSQWHLLRQFKKIYWPAAACLAGAVPFTQVLKFAETRAEDRAHCTTLRLFRSKPFHAPF